MRFVTLAGKAARTGLRDEVDGGQQDREQHGEQGGARMTDDAEIGRLIGRIGLGDRRAFAALYAAASPRLFGLCLRVTGDRDAAALALQDAFVAIWTDAAGFRGDGIVPWAWLSTVARNAAVPYRRARRARMPVTEDAAGLGDLGPEDSAADGRGQMAAGLAALDPERAEALRRAYLDGEEYDDLGARFGVPAGTMRHWVRRSLLRLREVLT